MEANITKAQRWIITGIYIYLALPIVIFFLGWCRWYIGIPAAIIVIGAVVLCVREYGSVIEKRMRRLSDKEKWKIGAVVLIVCVWVVLSGIGGYTWQNSDHWTRNMIFDLLMEQKWAPVKVADINGSLQERGMVYYIGFWLPAAVIGKLFGTDVGYAAQYVWAVIGILLFYALICVWRKKIEIWPLVLFIMFSGLDAVGLLMSRTDEFQIFGTLHLEAWADHYQFSSITTQLFWVFNQAIPAWLVGAMLFLCERPKNIIFIWSLSMLTSTLPFVGFLPYVIYFMIRCSEWKGSYKSVKEVLKDIWKNWGSLQNLLAGGIVGIISALYFFGNNSLLSSISLFNDNTLSGGIVLLIVLVLLILVAAIFYGVTLLVIKGWGSVVKYVSYILGIVVVIMLTTLPICDWQTTPFFLMNMTVFFFLEAGVHLICLYPMIKDKTLFKITCIWLYVIPLIIVGTSCDFCMRASIPGLLLIILWCIQMLGSRKKDIRTYVLIGLLIIGAITPIHEIKRTYANTRGYYENLSMESDVIYQAPNFSGSTDGFFWKYIAKPGEE